MTLFRTGIFIRYVKIVATNLRNRTKRGEGKMSKELDLEQIYADRIQYVRFSNDLRDSPTAYFMPSDVRKILSEAKQLKAQRDIAIEALRPFVEAHSHYDVDTTVCKCAGCIGKKVLKQIKEQGYEQTDETKNNI